MSDQILQVSQLNRYVNRLLQQDWLLPSLRLKGEISGFKAYPSGHWYFTLKDSAASVNCVMFRSSALRMSFIPRNGDRVILHGAVKLYEPNGTYQFVADSMRTDGVGDLYQQFEMLKQRLMAEGLFDPERKKPLPARPRRIAVITSEAGAVLHDIRHVSAARDSGIPLVLLPVPVQGEGAGEQIAAAVRLAPKLPMVDVIIVGRGGGSMEDLWCFNSEVLARAIADCPIPVISAVGHETDFTICDFVADVRAATPSNAAELAVPDRAGMAEDLSLLRRRLDRAVLQRLQQDRLRLSGLRARMTAAGPMTRLQHTAARAQSLRVRLQQAALMGISLRKPRLSMAGIRLDNAADHALQQYTDRLARLSLRLKAADPRRPLEKGYALVMGPSGVVTSASDAPEHMTLQFSDGCIAVRREEEASHGDH